MASDCSSNIPAPSAASRLRQPLGLPSRSFPASRLKESCWPPPTNRRCATPLPDRPRKTALLRAARSEERRGGKEGRSRWAPDHLKKKKKKKEWSAYRQ